MAWRADWVVNRLALEPVWSELRNESPGSPQTVTQQHTTPILISGYYGFGNTGDEAILQATIEGLRRRGHTNIAVLSADPAGTAGLWDVPAFHRYRPQQFLPFMRRGGLFLSGGGGLFQDTTSRRSLFYYLAMLQIARARGMKTLVYAQGLGPLHRSSSRRAVRWALRRVDRINFRDEASADLLAEIGLPHRAVVTADPAFTLEPAPPARTHEILAASGAPAGTPLLAIAVRPWGRLSEGGRNLLASVLREAAAEHEAHLLFVTMHGSEDRAASTDLADRIGRPRTILGEKYTPGEIAGVLGQCQALAAMRLHALILGGLSGVPATALTYDPKVDAAALQLGVPSLDVRHLERESLEAAVRNALHASAAERQRIRAAAAGLKERAEENFRIMEELMERVS